MTINILLSKAMIEVHFELSKIIARFPHLHIQRLEDISVEKLKKKTIALVDNEQDLKRVASFAKAIDLILMWSESEKISDYSEDPRIDCVVRDLEEIESFLSATPCNQSVSLVLLAYNEAESLAKAIADASRFASFYFSDHEIVVVDDGSSDRTQDLLSAIDNPALKIVRHEVNLGMGAALRSGFYTATMEWIAPFPADRQIRPHNILAFLPNLKSGHVRVGRYPTPHSGGMRALLSKGFRFGVAHLSGLKVPFDGAYLFESSWLQKVDKTKIQSQSFVYSYELLNELMRLGAIVSHYDLFPYLRQRGSSKVANSRRILRVFKELCISRFRRALF